MAVRCEHQLSRKRIHDVHVKRAQNHYVTIKEDESVNKSAQLAAKPVCTVVRTEGEFVSEKPKILIPKKKNEDKE